jgi:NTE family protein
MAEATELRLQQHPPDLLIQPDVTSIATLDLSTPGKGYAIGLAAARELAGELIDLRLWRNGIELAVQSRKPRSRTYKAQATRLTSAASNSMRASGTPFANGKVGNPSLPVS